MNSGTTVAVGQAMTTTKIWLQQREQPVSLGRTKAATTVLTGATSDFKSGQDSGGGALR